MWSERGLRIDAIRIEAMSWRALSLSELGRSHEALAAYEEALTQAPGDPTILNNLAWFLLEPGEGVEADPARAQALATQALAHVEAPVPAYLDTLARAYWLQGQRKEAIDLQRQAALLDPADEHIRSTLEQYEHRMKEQP